MVRFIMKTAKLYCIDTEGAHFEQLIDALRKAREAAERRQWDQGFLKDCVKHATALAFYRNDSRWSRVAAMLDELAKQPPGAVEDHKRIVELFNGVITAVRKLMLRRLN